MLQPADRTRRGSTSPRSRVLALRPFARCPARWLQKAGEVETEQRAGRKPWAVLAQPLPSPRTSASSSAGGGRAGVGSQGGCEGRRKVKCGLRLLGLLGQSPTMGTCSSRSRGRKPKIEVMSRSLLREPPVLVRRRRRLEPCPQVEEEMRDLSGASLTRTLKVGKVCLRGLIPPQRSQLQTSSLWGLEYLHVNLGERQTFGP